MVTVRRPGTPPAAWVRGAGAGSGAVPRTGAGVAVRTAGAGVAVRTAGAGVAVRTAGAAVDRPPSIACRRGWGRGRAGSRRVKASCQTSSSIRNASGGTDARGRGIGTSLFLALTGLADGLAPKEWRYARTRFAPTGGSPASPPWTGFAGIQLCAGGNANTGRDRERGQG